GLFEAAEFCARTAGRAPPNRGSPNRGNNDLRDRSMTDILSGFAHYNFRHWPAMAHIPGRSLVFVQNRPAIEELTQLTRTDSVLIRFLTGASDVNHGQQKPA